MEMPWITAVFFKIFAEVQDQIIDCARIRINRITPYGLKDFFPLDHLVLIFNQQLQQHGFFFTQSKSFIFFIKRFLGIKVNHILSKNISVGDGIAFLQSFVFVNQFLYTEQQFFQIKRFIQIIIGSFFQSEYTVGTTVAGAENKYGNRILPYAYGFRYIDAIRYRAASHPESRDRNIHRRWLSWPDYHS
jgi:hypothetical protein